MEFEWDEANRGHLQEHFAERRIGETDVEFVLSGDSVSMYESSVESEDERWVDGGFTSDGRLIFVVWTWRGPKVRPITAWLPEPAEVRLFERRRQVEYGE